MEIKARCPLCGLIGAQMARFLPSQLGWQRFRAALAVLAVVFVLAVGWPGTTAPAHAGEPVVMSAMHMPGIATSIAARTASAASLAVEHCSRASRRP